jgi:hypothetical protein
MGSHRVVAKEAARLRGALVRCVDHLPCGAQRMRTSSSRGLTFGDRDNLGWKQEVSKSKSRKSNETPPSNKKCT